jgi:hypothetical protein
MIAYARLRDVAITVAPTVMIRARLFPSRVAMPDGTVHEDILTLIGLDRVWFYQAGDRLLGEYLLEDLWGSARDGYGILTEGQEIKVTRGKSCGCGSKYKGGKNPFPIRMAMYPTPKKRSNWEK